MTTAVLDHCEIVADLEETPTEDWLALRRLGLGGSDVAAALGLSPYMAPLELHWLKTGEVPDKPSSRRMEFGHELEDVIARMWARENGKPLAPGSWLLRSKQLPWAQLTPDKLVGTSIDDATGVLEVKNADARQSHNWADDEAPLHYQVQVLWGLVVTGLDVGHLTVLLGGNTLKHVTFTREEYQPTMDRIVERAGAFWEDVQAGREPPADASESSTRALKARFSADPETVCELDDEDFALITRLVTAKAAAKEADAAVDEVENLLRQRMGEREIGTFNDRVVLTWKQQKERAGYWVEARPGNRPLLVPERVKREVLAL